jgi:hypothetical protein
MFGQAYADFLERLLEASVLGQTCLRAEEDTATVEHNTFFEPPFIFMPHGCYVRLRNIRDLTLSDRILFLQLLDTAWEQEVCRAIRFGSMNDVFYRALPAKFKSNFEPVAMKTQGRAFHRARKIVR